MLYGLGLVLYLAGFGVIAVVMAKSVKKWHRNRKGR
jgi:hypothetical protein